MAEGVGFEPTIRLPVYTLSKRAPSATRPSLRDARGRERPALGRLAGNIDAAILSASGLGDGAAAGPRRGGSAPPPSALAPQEPSSLGPSQAVCVAAGGLG